MGAKTTMDSDRSPLDGLFHSRSVALVGATDRSVWSQAACANFGGSSSPAACMW